MAGIYRTAAIAMAGAAADWTAENVVLNAGEVGIEIDTGKTKMGDGATAWTSLAYVGATSGSPAVTSVAGRTGAVVLAAADVSGVATPTTVSAQITAAAPVAATKTAAGLVQQLAYMGPQTFATVADVQTAFNALLLALIAKGMMAAS